MKIQINKVILDQVASKFGKIMSANSTLPILEGVLVQATPEFICFTASDIEQSKMIREMVSDDVVVLEAGSTVLPKAIFSLTRKLKSDLITFELNEDCTQVTITQKKTVINYQVLMADEFPKIAPTQAVTGKYKLPMKAFKDIVETTSFAVSKSDSRPILKGIALHLTAQESGTNYSVVATDSHRLAKIQSPNFEATDMQQIIVPASSLQQAIKTFGHEGNVGIVTYSQQIALVNGNTILYCRLLEGNYPDTSRLIPEANCHFTLNTKEMIEALELVKELVKTLKDTTILLEYLDKQLTLTSNVPGGISKTKQVLTMIDSEVGDEFKMSFSADYVLEALRTIETDTVLLEFTGPMRPFLLKNVYSNPEAHDETLQLVLPVRIY